MNVCVNVITCAFGSVYCSILCRCILLYILGDRNRGRYLCYRTWRFPSRLVNFPGVDRDKMLFFFLEDSVTAINYVLFNLNTRERV